MIEEVYAALASAVTSPQQQPNDPAHQECSQTAHLNTLNKMHLLHANLQTVIAENWQRQAPSVVDRVVASSTTLLFPVRRCHKHRKTRSESMIRRKHFTSASRSAISIKQGTLCSMHSSRHLLTSSTVAVVSPASPLPNRHAIADKPDLTILSMVDL
jgi:hypothetical protein